MEKKRLSSSAELPIMCKCVKCGELGFVKIEKVVFDDNGYVKDIKCPCGGRLEKFIKL